MKNRTICLPLLVQTFSSGRATTRTQMRLWPKLTTSVLLFLYIPRNKKPVINVDHARHADTGSTCCSGQLSDSFKTLPSRSGIVRLIDKSYHQLPLKRYNATLCQMSIPILKHYHPFQWNYSCISL